MPTIEQALADVAATVNDTLDRLLPIPDGPEARVMEAMRYATLGSGKRIRPFLVVSSARLFNVPTASLLASDSCFHSSRASALPRFVSVSRQARPSWLRLCCTSPRLR